MLHNRCLDWGLRKLKPGQNRDPDIEMLIRVNAHSRFTRQNRHLAEEGQLGDEEAPENHGPTAAGIFRRNHYIHRNYVGDPPAPLPVRGRGCGCGRGCGRGGGRGRGRGHGRGHGRVQGQGQVNL